MSSAATAVGSSTATAVGSSTATAVGTATGSSTATAVGGSHVAYTVTRNEDGSWAFAWTFLAASYELWLDGEQIEAAATTGSYDLSHPRYVDDTPPLELVEAGHVAGSSLYPPLVKIQWRGLQAADGYEVQKYDGVSAWNTVGTQEEVGAGYYLWTSDAQADVTTHQYRVRAISYAGQEGTPVAFDVFVVRNPPPPSVSMSVDVNGDVEVASG